MKVEGMQCRGNQRNPTISCTLFKFACSRMQIAESDIPSLVCREGHVVGLSLPVGHSNGFATGTVRCHGATSQEIEIN